MLDWLAAKNHGISIANNRPLVFAEAAELGELDMHIDKVIFVLQCATNDCVNY